MKPFPALFIAVALVACDRVPTEAPNQFVIRVDSISAPTDVAFGEVFTATFFGPIGLTSCYSLRRVEQSLSFTDAEFVFIGEKCASGGSFQAVVVLNHSVLIQPRGAGEFSIRVRQPDGSLLSKQVPVR